MALAVTGSQAHENKGTVCSNTCTNSSTKKTEAHLTLEEAENGEGHSFTQTVAYIWERNHHGRMHHTFKEDIQITTT